MAINLIDEKIMRLLKKDSNAGMDLLVETYGALAAYIIRRKISAVCSEYDVEECVAETFVDLYTQRECIDLRKGTLKGYVSMIARRRAIDRFNRALRQTGSSAELDETELYAIPDRITGVEQTVEQKETGAALLEEVNRLGEPDSEILFRRYYLEQSLNEIAAAIGMKRPAVSKRIERALEKLRISMEGYI